MFNNQKYDALFKLMKEKDIDAQTVKKRMETFVGLEVNEKLKGTKWEQLH